MKKIIKLSLLGTLLSASTLAIALPIVSCSSSADTGGQTILIHLL